MEENLSVLEGLDIKDMPADVVRKLVLASPLALGAYVMPRDEVKSFVLNQHIDRHMRKLGHGPNDSNRLIINVSPQLGKCVAAGTQVLTEYGNVCVEDVQAGWKVASYLDGALVWQTVTETSSEPSKRAYRIRTRLGRRLTVSHDHPVLCCDENGQIGYIKAEDIKPGRDFAIGLMGEIDGEEVISDDLVKFLAYMIFEGSCSQISKMFSTGSESCLSDFTSVCERLGVKVRRKSKYDYRVVGSNSILRRFGVHGKLSKDKRLPAEILNASLRQKWLFIGIMFETDGYFSGNAGGIGLASHRLIDDIQLLLASVGIPATKCKHRRDNGKAGVSELAIGRKYVEKVIHSCDLPDKYWDAVAVMVGPAVRDCRSMVYPYGVMNSFSGWKKDARKAGIGLHRPSRNITEGKFDRICSLFPDDLNDYRLQDFHYDCIVECEDTGEDLPMFHLTVEGTENYVAEGIVNHNTHSACCWIVNYLIRNPDRKVVYLSYSEERANTVGVQTREFFDAVGCRLFGYKIDKKLSSRDEWKIDKHQGGLVCRGINQGITGRTAHVIVFDDPYKSHEDATSEAGRKLVIDLWDSAIRSRRQENTIIILIQTRWSPDDLTGHVLKQEAQGLEKWDKLIVPALPEKDVYDSDGVLIVRGGECIECLKSEKLFREERDAISEYFWNALYQQRPISLEGSIWQDAFSSSDTFCDSFPTEGLSMLVVAVDPAAGSERARGDFSAIVAVGIIGDGKLYVEADLKRSGPEDTINRLITFVKALPREPDVIGIESVAFQDFVRKIGAKQLIDANVNSPVYAMQPVMLDVVKGTQIRANKMERIVSKLDPIVRAGMLKFVRTSKGCAEVIKQMELIPQQGKGVHDDGPDCLEMCVRLVEQIHKEREYEQEVLNR